MDVEATVTSLVTPIAVDRSVDNASEGSLKSGQSNWRLFGQRVPKTECVFAVQILMLYIIIITCLMNLTMGHADSNLWTVLLSSSLGLMLPSPSLKRSVKK